MPKHIENGCGESSVYHPLVQLLRFSLIAASLLFAESLAIHPSSGVNSRSRRSASFRKVGHYRKLNANDLVSPTVLLNSARSEIETEELVVNGDSLAEIETTINSINKDENITDIQHTAFTTSVQTEPTQLSIWPQFDALDKRLMKVALPCIASCAITPLIGAVDLFWVNRMGNALAVAGQAAANQLFNTAFWMISFLPQATRPLVAQAKAKGDKEELQDAVSQVLAVGLFVSLIGSISMLTFPEKVLATVLKDGAPALEFAKPYLFIRSFSVLPSCISTIGFSVFQATLDTSTPMKISLFSQAFNAILDPILMFTLAMGVTGAAFATLSAELISAACFVTLMLRRQWFRWSKIFKLPSWSKLQPLLKGSAALQLRNVALNLTFLAVTRVTQSLDNTGLAASAHALAIQTFQLGGIFLLALSVTAQAVVPNELIEKVDKKTGKRHGGKSDAKVMVNRLMSWGFILGGILGALQMLLLPVIQKSSPLLEVRQAAVMPSIICSILQLINGLVFIGEGVMVACGSYMQLSLSTVIASLGTLISLNTLPNVFGLTGVWMSFGVFNVLRLTGVFLHQTRFGPLAKANMANETK